MPPFNNKPPTSNRPPLKPMTQTLNVKRPVLPGQNVPAQNNDAPLTTDRKPARSQMTSSNNDSTPNNREKSLRLSTGSANNLIQPILSQILSQYASQDLTVTGVRTAFTNDLNNQLPLGKWAVTASQSLVRMTVTSIDRKTTLIYLYQ